MPPGPLLQGWSRRHRDTVMRPVGVTVENDAARVCAVESVFSVCTSRYPGRPGLNFERAHLVIHGCFRYDPTTIL